VKSAFFLVDLLERYGYSGPKHFDYKQVRTDGDSGVWASATSNMRMYLVLKERAEAFRKDPRVIAAMKESNIPGLSEPTLAAGETWKDLAKDSFDAEAAGKRGYGYEVLDQLAMEHLMGVTA
jgi:xylose isomerase